MAHPLSDILHEQLDYLLGHSEGCRIPEGCPVCNRYAVVKDMLAVGFQTVEFPSHRMKPRPASSQKSLTRKK